MRHKTSCTGVGNSASTYLKHSKSKVYVIDFLKKYYKKTNWYGIAEVELEKYKGKHRRDDIEKVWGSTSKIEEKEETVKLIEEMYGEVKDVLQKDSYFMRKEGIDNRYEDIKKSILYSQHEIISFDIFDTLILRPFYKPSDLFTLLNPYFESICSERPFSEFSKIREDAEIQVRRINKQKYPQLEEIRLHDIYDLQPLKTFVYQRVILLGDAAHATTPNMGQGAGQAMEDAIVLANCLQAYPFEAALQRYDKIRVDHTKKVIKRSRKIGKLAQRSNKIVISLRNSIAKIMPNRLVAAQTKFIYKSKNK